jgi:hypothetical protein
MRKQRDPTVDVGFFLGKKSTHLRKQILDLSDDDG